MGRLAQQGVNLLLLFVVLATCVYHALFTRCDDVMAAAKLLFGVPLGLSTSGAAQRPSLGPTGGSLGPTIGPTIAPTVAADLFAKGNAAHARGDLETAASLFTQAFRAFPGYGLAYTNLGNIYLQQNQVRLALQTHMVALQYRERDARAWYNVAVAHHRLGQLLEAKRHYSKALALQPDYANALYNLALAEQDNHELEAAAGHYTELLALDPGHVDGRVNLCNVLLAQQSSDFAVVERCYKDTLALFPSHAKTAVNLAALYHSHASSSSSSDDLSAAYVSQAAAYYKQALSLEPGNVMAQHGLRSVTGGEGDAQRRDIKAEYVAELFDSYSFHFDDSLAQLQYRAHSLVAEAALKWLLSSHKGTALKARVAVADLGCGTGLVCPRLRSGFEEAAASSSSSPPSSSSSSSSSADATGGSKPVLDVLGIDLSPKMIQKAQGKGCYDKAVTGEVVAVVSDLPAASLHAAVAADVVCYFGDLVGLLASVRAALIPGGVFTFTVETGTDPAVSAGLEDSCSFALQFSGRFAHSECAVRKAATEGGWEVVEANRMVPRLDKGAEVPGLLVSLR